MSDITKAPNKAISFAKNNPWAFGVVALAAMLVAVYYTLRDPGKVADKVEKIPLLGKKVANRE